METSEAKWPCVHLRCVGSLVRDLPLAMIMDERLSLVDTVAVGASLNTSQYGFPYFESVSLEIW